MQSSRRRMFWRELGGNVSRFGVTILVVGGLALSVASCQQPPTTPAAAWLPLPSPGAPRHLPPQSRGHDPHTIIRELEAIWAEKGEFETTAAYRVRLENGHAEARRRVGDEVLLFQQTGYGLNYDADKAELSLARHDRVFGGEAILDSTDLGSTGKSYVVLSHQACATFEPLPMPAPEAKTLKTRLTVKGPLRLALVGRVDTSKKPPRPSAPLVSFRANFGTSSALYDLGSSQNLLVQTLSVELKELAIYDVNNGRRLATFPCLSTKVTPTTQSREPALSTRKMVASEARPSRADPPEMPGPVYPSRRPPTLEEIADINRKLQALEEDPDSPMPTSRPPLDPPKPGDLPIGRRQD
jgi:hypothetical protein